MTETTTTQTTTQTTTNEIRFALQEGYIGFSDREGWFRFCPAHPGYPARFDELTVSQAKAWLKGEDND